MALGSQILCDLCLVLVTLLHVLGLEMTFGRIITKNLILRSVFEPPTPTFCLFVLLCPSQRKTSRFGNFSYSQELSSL